MNKELPILESLFFFLFGLRKGKIVNLIVPSSELHLVFGWICSMLGIEKALNTLLWTLIGGRVGYHGWTEFGYVWLELDWNECRWRVCYKRGYPGFHTFLGDLGEGRGCSANIVVIKSLNQSLSDHLPPIALQCCQAETLRCCASS